MRRGTSIAVLVILVLIELPILLPPSLGVTDHLIFWNAGHIIVTGGSPYDAAAWADAQRRYDSAHLALFVDLSAPVWVYPAWTAFLFIPFGLLGYPAGPWILAAALVIVALAAAWIFARSLPAEWGLRPEAALVPVAIFQPLVIADRYGQFGSFLLLGLVLVFLGLKDRRTLAFVAGALILFTKPQLFLVTAPMVLVLLVRERAWRTMGVTGGALALVAIATTLAYPESLAIFTQGAGERAAAFGMYSSTWALARLLTPAAWPLVGAALACAAIAGCVAAVRAVPSDLKLATLMAASVIVSLVVTPVDFYYDHAPLVLALVMMAAIARRGGQIAAITVVAVLIPWLAFFTALAIGDPESQALTGIVPVLFGPLLWYTTAGSRSVGVARVKAKAAA
jgi:hypothetical protein